MGKILERIDSPADLKKLSLKELKELSEEIRLLIIETVSKTGGHLAANLGTVELTLALHYCLNMPQDVILWDVGHQSYTHKIITGRKSKFSSLRQAKGISGFPDKDESPYDIFTVGHSSTSISWALGMVCARDLKQEKQKVAVVIGDASLAGGMAFEALNHAGHLKKDLIIILNDNELSISPSIGALSRYLNRIATSPVYNRIRKDIEKVLKHVPWFGFRSLMAAKRLERGLRNMLVPGMLFEELGFRYFGPIDGHDIVTMINTFKSVMNLDEPVLIHLLTKKGKGYSPAEKFPAKYHSAAEFEVESGTMACSNSRSYTQVFGEKITELAQDNERIVAITAAMPGGTGLEKFAEKFPQRFFDAGIAEEHAIGLAAGISRGGFIPIVAIYSTFLQRGYDQIIHDVCLQKLPMVFVLDRAGIVPDDGPTHNGIFDIAYLRHIPNLILMAPSDRTELEHMVSFALNSKSACAIRYPKACADENIKDNERPSLSLGKSRILRKGKDAVIFALGSLVANALEAAELLLRDDIYLEVIDARFVCPLDKEMLKEKANQFKIIFTVEDGVLNGGFGSAVCEFVENNCPNVPHIKNMGIPNEFLKHGPREAILNDLGLSPAGIAGSVKAYLNNFVFK